MVCLFGTAINATTVKNNDNDDFDKYTDWSWLIYDIADFIYQKSPEYDTQDGEKYNHPVIPYSNSSIWGNWFNNVIDELKTEFNDVNPSLCLRVLENCPTEEVAMLIFNTIEITVVTEFISKYVY